MKQKLGQSNVIAMYGLLLCLLLPFNAAAQDADDYRLAPGDVIQVSVYDEPDLSLELAIPGNGRVDYAFVGELMLAGKTVGEVEREVYRLLLGDYLVEPTVSVAVVTYRDFYVYGEVSRPGNYPWQPGLTVRKVITLAGGLKERASQSKWFLVPEGGSESEQRKVTGDDAVGPGDTVTIGQSFF
jgi:polysaccharide export outer membrane protein